MAVNQDNEKLQDGQQNPPADNNSQTPPTGNSNGGGTPPSSNGSTPPPSNNGGSGEGNGEGATVTPPTNSQPSGQGGGTGTEGGDAPQSDAPQPRQQPYSQFSGNNYEDVENFIRQQMADYTPETEEERKKRERHEKRTKSLAAIADILGSMHKAYSYQRGVAPMDLPNMTEKAQARFDKAKAERDKDRDRYLNYAITLGNLKDKDRDFNFRIEQARNQQNNWQASFDANRKDRADDVAYRDKAYDDSRKDRADDVAWRKERAGVEDEHWNRNFNESIRQFNVNSSLQRQSLSLQAQRLQMERENNSAFYTLGEGQGSVTVPKSAINSLNFAAVYHSLPQSYQNAHGDPIITKDALGNSVVSGYGDPSAEAMAIAVGAYLGDSNVPANQKTATRTALSQLGKKKGGNNRTMPGVN